MIANLGIFYDVCLPFGLLPSGSLPHVLRPRLPLFFLPSPLSTLPPPLSSLRSPLSTLHSPLSSLHSPLSRFLQDMTKLTNLNEPNVLHNLAVRYDLD